MGISIYALVWLTSLILRRDLRKKILFSSILGSILGLSELLFIPEYWSPVFQTIPILKDLFLESILFCFFLGGSVPVLYQVLFKEKLLTTNKVNPSLTLIAPFLFLTYFLKLTTLNIMYYVCGSMLVSSIAILPYLKKNIAKRIFCSAALNTVLYFGLYLIAWETFPELSASYTLENLSGISLIGIPIEEIAWIFSFALYFTPIYEIWMKK